jgi:catechol 2,3-dioxygenase-like lactoylglutathione lyase family enzyme
MNKKKKSIPISRNENFVDFLDWLWFLYFHEGIQSTGSIMSFFDILNIPGIRKIGELRNGWDGWILV